MSKRSYRRLAVLAGAAFAVGSMAPALADDQPVHVNHNVEVKTSGGPQAPVESVGLFAGAIQGSVADITGAATDSVPALTAALRAFAGYVGSPPPPIVDVNRTGFLAVTAKVDADPVAAFVLGAPLRVNDLRNDVLTAAAPLRAEVQGTAAEARDAFLTLQGSLRQYIGGIRSDPTSVVPDVDVTVAASIVASL